MDSKETRDRDGKGFKWKMNTCNLYSHGTTEASGYTIDNLNTKSLQEASSNFERIFIQVREVLLNYEGSIEDNRYDVCHKIARVLSQNIQKL